MQAKCESLRWLVMAEVEKKKRGEDIKYTDIAKKFNIHPNTVSKYVRQSIALKPSYLELKECVDRLDIPSLYLISRLSKSGEALLDILGGKIVLPSGEDAPSLKQSSSRIHEGHQWVTYKRRWFKNDDTLNSKKELIRLDNRGWDSDSPQTHLTHARLVDLIDRAGIPNSKLCAVDSPPILSLRGEDELTKALDAHRELSDRRASAHYMNSRVFDRGSWWVSRSGFWVVDDEQAEIKEVVLQLGLGLMPVPSAKKGGGVVPSTVRLSKQHKIFFSQVLHATTLSLVSAAEYIRLHVDDTFPRVSEPTLCKVADALGFKKKRNTTFDPKKTARLAKELEEKSFQKELRSKNGALRGENLLFIDECNFHLNMDEDPGESWSGGGEKKKVPVSKGKSQYVSLVLTVGLVFEPDVSGESASHSIESKWVSEWHKLANGILRGKEGVEAIGGWSIVDGTDANIDSHLLLFWHIIPPKRAPHLTLSYDFEEPFTEEEDTYWRKIRTKLKIVDCSSKKARNVIEKMDMEKDSVRRFMETVLFYLGVDSRVVDGDDRIDAHRSESDDVVRERFISLVVEKSRVNMPRRFVGPRYRGGSSQPELSTTSKFMHYLHTLSTYTRACFGERVRGDCRLFVDNASTHGRVNVDSSSASFLHAYAQSLGFEGAIFPPSLSPKYNVAEVAFAYVKTLLRNISMAPSGQHTVASLTDAVEGALMQITPAMVAAWTTSRGYRFDAAIKNHQLPLGLFTHPIVGSTGEVVYSTGRYTADLHRTGEVDTQALRLAYPVHSATTGEDVQTNRDIVTKELERVEGVVHGVVELRLDFQDMLSEAASKKKKKRDASTGKALTERAHALLLTFIETFPLYSATYAQLVHVMTGKTPVGVLTSSSYKGQVAASSLMLSESQLDDVLLVMSEVLKYHADCVKRARSSARKLCSLGMTDACTITDRASTASVCSRSFSTRYRNVVCMNEMGHITTKASMRVEDESSRSRSRRSAHLRFGKEMGILGPVLEKTARLVSEKGVDLRVSKILSLAPKRKSSDLRSFAEKVVEYLNRGALRPHRAPCAKIQTIAEGEALRVMIRDWNEWVPMTRRRKSKQPPSIRLKEHRFPEYILMGSEKEFDRRNIWGKLSVEIVYSLGSLEYKHIGFNSTERLRQIALSSLNEKNLSSLGASVVCVNDRDARKQADVSYHPHTREHLPLWIVDRLDDNLLELAGDPSSLQTGKISTGSGEVIDEPSSSSTDGSGSEEVPSSTTGDLYSRVWSYYILKAKVAGLSLYDGDGLSDKGGRCPTGSGTRRCTNYRKLRRLLLDMKFPAEVIKEVNLFKNVTGQRDAPLFSASEIRSKARWQKQQKKYSYVERGHGSTKNLFGDHYHAVRWAGYPKISYSEALRAVRDVHWISNPIRSAASYVKKYEGQINQDAMHVLNPYKKYLDIVFLNLSNRKYFKKFWSAGDTVPTSLLSLPSNPDNGIATAQVQKLIKEKTPIKLWSEKDVELWNLVLHDTLEAEIPAPPAMVYPIVLFMSVGEYRECFDGEVKSEGEEKFRLALNLLLYRQVHEASHSVWTVEKVRKKINSMLTANTGDTEWIAILPVNIGVESSGEDITFVLTEDNGITLRMNLEDIEAKMRVGMPWEFIDRITLKQTNDVFREAKRAYELDEFSATDYKRVIGLISKLFHMQAQDYAEQSEEKEKKEDAAFLSDVKTLMLRASDFVMDEIKKGKIEASRAAAVYINTFQSEVSKLKKTKANKTVKRYNQFNFYPVEADMSMYYVIESTNDRENATTVFNLQYLNDITDVWVQGMVSVCRQRNAQRRSRSARVPSDVNQTAPRIIHKTVSYVATQSPVLFMAEETRTKKRVDALSLIMKSSDREESFHLYRRDNTVDASSPGVFTRVTTSPVSAHKIGQLLPAPLHKSTDRSTLLYGGPSYGSIRTALKGLTAYIEDTHFERKDVLILHNKQIWSKNRGKLDPNKVPVPVIRVSDDDSTSCQLMLRVETGEKRRVRAEWTSLTSDVQRLGLSVRVPLRTGAPGGAVSLPLMDEVDVFLSPI